MCRIIAFHEGPKNVNFSLQFLLFNHACTKVFILTFFVKHQNFALAIATLKLNLTSKKGFYHIFWVRKRNEVKYFNQPFSRLSRLKKANWELGSQIKNQYSTMLLCTLVWMCNLNFKSWTGTPKKHLMQWRQHVNNCCRLLSKQNTSTEIKSLYMATILLELLLKNLKKIDNNIAHATLMLIFSIVI